MTRSCRANVPSSTHTRRPRQNAPDTPRVHYMTTAPVTKDGIRRTALLRLREAGIAPTTAHLERVCKHPQHWERALKNIIAGCKPERDVS